MWQYFFASSLQRPLSYYEQHDHHEFVIPNLILYSFQERDQLHNSFPQKLFNVPDDSPEVVPEARPSCLTSYCLTNC